MIPLKDDTPRLSTPLVNYFLIAANVAVFLFQISLDRRAQIEFVRTFGLVPERVMMILHGALPHAHAHGDAVSPLFALLPVLTSMFLHDGIWHIVFNMWFLLIFGRNVEESLGDFPYLIFYLAC